LAGEQKGEIEDLLDHESHLYVTEGQHAAEQVAGQAEQAAGTEQGLAVMQ
jgi:hypothetical protein